MTADDSAIILSIRSTSDDGHLFGAAHAQGTSTHEIIRRAALARLTQEAPA